MEPAHDQDVNVLLSRTVVHRGGFTSRADLVATIMEVIRHDNQEAAPVQWTYAGTPLAP